METNKLYLKDLICSTTPMPKTLLLKVVAKTEPIEGEGKITFQGYTFIDEQGTKRRASVFNKNVAFFNKILITGEVYEITKAIVREIASRYAMYPNEKQLTLTATTRVHNLTPTTPPILFTPTYLPLVQVPTMINKETFDIAVIVVRVDPPHQVISKATGNTVDLCEMFVTDDSINEVIPMSAWKVHAHESQQITKWNTIRSIVVFNSVRAVTYNNTATLSTTYGTKIDLLAEEERPTALKKWFEENKGLLSDRALSFVESRSIKKEIESCTLAETIKKELTQIQEGDLIKVLVFVKSFDNNSPRTRVSCRKCSNNFTEIVVGLKECEVCMEPAQYTAKMFIDFTAIDDKTTYEFLAQTRSAEKILGIKAIEYHNMSSQERSAFMKNAKKTLSSKKIPLVLTPTPTQLDHGEIHWDLKYVDTN